MVTYCSSSLSWCPLLGSRKNQTVPKRHLVVSPGSTSSSEDIFLAHFTRVKYWVLLRPASLHGQALDLALLYLMPPCLLDGPSSHGPRSPFSGSLKWILSLVALSHPCI